MRSGCKGEIEGTQSQSQHSSAEVEVAERRREERQPVSCKVTFQLDGKAIIGVLVDVSPSGFRIRHSARLRSGTELDVASSCGVLRARVVWTRELPSSIDSGFLLLTGKSVLDALLDLSEPNGLKRRRCTRCAFRQSAYEKTSAVPDRL
jgi:PilZ domain